MENIRILERILVKIVDMGTLMSVKQYTAEWSRTSVKLDGQGVYAWMQTQLGTPKRVLEIGCGSGASTCAIVATGARVVAIESSPSAIQLTKLALENEGYSVSLVSLGSLTSATVNSQIDDVLLVEGSVLHPHLAQRLPREFFDAVACWLIGGAPSHVAQGLNRKIKQLTPDDMAKYRKLVHRTVFNLGASVLKSKGFVHIADRMGLAFAVPEADIGAKYVIGLTPFARSTDYDLVNAISAAKIIDGEALQGNIQYVQEPGNVVQLVAVPSVKIARI